MPSKAGPATRLRYMTQRLCPMRRSERTRDGHRAATGYDHQFRDVVNLTVDNNDRRRVKYTAVKPNFRRRLNQRSTPASSLGNCYPHHLFPGARRMLHRIALRLPIRETARRGQLRARRLIWVIRVDFGMSASCRRAARPGRRPARDDARPYVSMEKSESLRQPV